MEHRTLICKGSSSAASCSARSPVPLQSEKSDPAESEESRPSFSLVGSRGTAECWLLGPEEDAKVRSGMVTELGGFEEGMMPVIVGWRRAAQEKGMSQVKIFSVVWGVVERTCDQVWVMEVRKGNLHRGS